MGTAASELRISVLPLLMKTKHEWVKSSVLLPTWRRNNSKDSLHRFEVIFTRWDWCSTRSTAGSTRLREQLSRKSARKRNERDRSLHRTFAMDWTSSLNDSSCGALNGNLDSGPPP